MRYLTLDEILELRRLALEQSGSAAGLRALAALESAVQPYVPDRPSSQHELQQPARDFPIEQRHLLRRR